jgi:quercetin dioxygenase-like cupin family protein
MLEKNEGELRTRRPCPSVPNPASQIMLKAGPKNNGSQHFVVGTEEIAPGALIPTHKHLTQDEVVLIHSGTAHVRLGDQERDLHVGSMVFIPANTWVGLKNTSTEVMSITFVFSAPGFDNYLRCTSVPAGDNPTPMTQENWQQCQHEGHALSRRLTVYRSDRGPRSPLAGRPCFRRFRFSSRSFLPRVRDPRQETILARSFKRVCTDPWSLWQIELTRGDTSNSRRSSCAWLPDPPERSGAKRLEPQSGLPTLHARSRSSPVPLSRSTTGKHTAPTERRLPSTRHCL